MSADEKDIELTPGGDIPYEQTPDGELPGMWERADFIDDSEPVEEPKTSLGNPMGWFATDVPYEDLRAASDAGWASIRNHPAGASCECVASEVIGVLYGLGYRLVKSGNQR